MELGYISYNKSLKRSKSSLNNGCQRKDTLRLVAQVKIDLNSSIKALEKDLLSIPLQIESANLNRKLK